MPVGEAGRVGVPDEQHRAVDGPGPQHRRQRRCGRAGDPDACPGRPAGLRHQRRVVQRPAVGDQCRVAALRLRPGHQLVPVRRQLARLVHRTGRQRPGVGAGERGQGHHHAIGARPRVVGDGQVRVALDQRDRGADRPDRQGPVRRPPVQRRQVQPHARAGRGVVLLLQGVAGLGDPVGEDPPGQLDPLASGGPGRVVVEGDPRARGVGADEIGEDGGRRAHPGSVRAIAFWA